MVRKVTPAEASAAYHDPRQRELPLDREPTPKRDRKQPGPLTKHRWLNRYFETHNYLTAGGGQRGDMELLSSSAVRQHAAAIAYRHTLERVMNEYRAKEKRAVAFLKWCGLEDKRMSRQLAKEKLDYIEFQLRRRAGA